MSENVADKGEVEISTGGQCTTIKIWRAAVNNELACFKDVVAEGLRKLDKKNLHVVRFCSFLRENRKRKLDDDVYNEVTKYSNGSDECMEDEIDLAKLKRMRFN